MKRLLHEQIKSAFNSEELSQFCFLLGVAYEDVGGGTLAAKVLACQQMMGRLGRMNELLVALKGERPYLDLRPYLFHVILEKYNSEKAITQLLQAFALPVRDFPEPEKFAWGSEAWREQKAVGLQAWAEENGRLPQLLDLLQAQKADLSFY
ncbi:MAG: hypothetical protein H6658_12620 [Ardenticatenaceae bacterium]|nr:hypothetical protein [Ardenticatenaceae bacterium]